MTERPKDPELPLPDTGFGTVEDWSKFIGTEDATQLLSGLSALGGSQDLLEQITQAVLPAGNAPGLSGALYEAPADPAETLRRSELRFRSLVENLPAVAFVAGMGQGRSEVYINPYIEKLLGYTKEEWLRDPFLWYWRVHPDDRELWNQEFARGLVTGGPWQADCRFLAADGHAVWVRGQATIVRDELGRPLFLQGIAFDISAIKAAEQRARTQRDDVVRLIEVLPQPAIAIGAAGEVLCVNVAARSLLALEGELPAEFGPLSDRAFGAAAPSAADLVVRTRVMRNPQRGLIRAPSRELRAQCLPAPDAGDAAFPVLLLLEP